MENISKEDAVKIRQMIKYHDPEFYFVPSAKLREIVAKGERLEIQGLPKSFKMMMLKNPPNPISIDAMLVLKYINGSIDEKNKFLFDNGVLRVIDNTFTINKENVNGIGWENRKTRGKR